MLIPTPRLVLVADTNLSCILINNNAGSREKSMKIDEYRLFAQFYLQILRT